MITDIHSKTNSITKQAKKAHNDLDSNYSFNLQSSSRTEKERAANILKNKGIKAVLLREIQWFKSKRKKRKKETRERKRGI